jgi:hypothetical protein
MWLGSPFRGALAGRSRKVRLLSVLLIGAGAVPALSLVGVGNLRQVLGALFDWIDAWNTPYELVILLGIVAGSFSLYRFWRPERA